MCFCNLLYTDLSLYSITIITSVYHQKPSFKKILLQGQLFSKSINNLLNNSQNHLQMSAINLTNSYLLYQMTY